MLLVVRPLQRERSEKGSESWLPSYTASARGAPEVGVRRRCWGVEMETSELEKNEKIGNLAS